MDSSDGVICKIFLLRGSDALETPYVYRGEHIIIKSGGVLAFYIEMNKHGFMRACATVAPSLQDAMRQGWPWSEEDPQEIARILFEKTQLNPESIEGVSANLRDIIIDRRYIKNARS